MNSQSRPVLVPHRKSSVGKAAAAIKAIRIQWRALLLAVCLLTSVLFYWLFYFIEIGKAGSAIVSSKLPDWTMCILDKGDQNLCSQLLREYMPSTSIMLAAEVIVSCMGLIFFLIFGAQAQFLHEWHLALLKFWDRLHETQLELDGKCVKKNSSPKNDFFDDIEVQVEEIVPSPTAFGAVYSRNLERHNSCDNGMLQLPQTKRPRVVGRSASTSAVTNV